MSKIHLLKLITPELSVKFTEAASEGTNLFVNRLVWTPVPVDEKQTFNDSYMLTIDPAAPLTVPAVPLTEDRSPALINLLLAIPDSLLYSKSPRTGELFNATETGARQLSNIFINQVIHDEEMAKLRQRHKLTSDTYDAQLAKQEFTKIPEIPANRLNGFDDVTAVLNGLNTVTNENFNRLEKFIQPTSLERAGIRANQLSQWVTSGTEIGFKQFSKPSANSPNTTKALLKAHATELKKADDAALRAKQFEQAKSRSDTLANLQYQAYLRQDHPNISHELTTASDLNAYKKLVKNMMRILKEYGNNAQILDIFKKQLEALAMKLSLKIEDVIEARKNTVLAVDPTTLSHYNTNPRAAPAKESYISSLFKAKAVEATPRVTPGVFGFGNKQREDEIEEDAPPSFSWLSPRTWKWKRGGRHNKTKSRKRRRTIRKK
jgi:hypothetical protein